MIVFHNVGPNFKAARTTALLDQLRGNPDEFAMLKGILQMTFRLGTEEFYVVTEVFDMQMISDRMDVIRIRPDSR